MTRSEGVLACVVLSNPALSLVAIATRVTQDRMTTIRLGLVVVGRLARVLSQMGFIKGAAIGLLGGPLGIAYVFWPRGLRGA
jgi:hypothetical protein